MAEAYRANMVPPHGGGEGHDHPGTRDARWVELNARYIYETGTKNGKRVQALGGAKNHMLVLPDADLDMAADALVGAAYGSAGERCMAISVVLAVDSIADELVAKVKDRIPNVIVGPGADPGSEMGPLISGEHRDKVAGYIADAAGEGATVVVDGRDGGRGRRQRRPLARRGAWRVAIH